MIKMTEYISDTKYANERYLELVQSCQFDEINQIITLTTVQYCQFSLFQLQSHGTFPPNNVYD